MDICGVQAVFLSCLENCRQPEVSLIQRTAIVPSLPKVTASASIIHKEHIPAVVPALRDMMGESNGYCPG